MLNAIGPEIFLELVAGVFASVVTSESDNNEVMWLQIHEISLRLHLSTKGSRWQTGSSHR
jgi:hypothetical protein